MSKMFLTCKLCDTIGGTDSVTHAITCIYKNHITYQKKNGKLLILCIENRSETETINKYNK
jgi:hypothetical protein